MKIKDQKTCTKHTKKTSIFFIDLSTLNSLKVQPTSGAGTEYRSGAPVFTLGA